MVWRREGGLMKGGGWKGVMQLWAMPAHLPQWKRTVYGAHPRFEKKSWEGSRGEAACLYAVSWQQLKTSPYQKKDILSILSLHIGAPLFSNSYHSSLFILMCTLTQHPVAPSFSPPLCSVPLILLPDYFGSDTQNGGGELRARRQRVEAIF